MKKDKYIPRIIDTIIKEYLDDFTAIYLRGPKWCEKPILLNTLQTVRLS